MSSSTQNLAAWLPAVARRCPAAFHRALLMRMCFRLLTLVAPEHGPTRDARRIFGRMARAISFGRIRGGSSSGSSEDAEDCKSSMADPKFYPPEFGMEEGAPALIWATFCCLTPTLAAEPIVDAPTRCGGSRRDQKQKFAQLRACSAMFHTVPADRTWDAQRIQHCLRALLGEFQRPSADLLRGGRCAPLQPSATGGGCRASAVVPSMESPSGSRGGPLKRRARTHVRSPFSPKRSLGVRRLLLCVGTVLRGGFVAIGATARYCRATRVASAISLCCGLTRRAGGRTAKVLHHVGLRAVDGARGHRPEAGLREEGGHLELRPRLRPAIPLCSSGKLPGMRGEGAAALRRHSGDAGG